MDRPTTTDVLTGALAPTIGVVAELTDRVGTGVADVADVVADSVDLEAVTAVVGDAIDVAADAGATGVRRASSFVRAHPVGTVALVAGVAAAASGYALWRRRSAAPGRPANLEPVSDAA